MIATETTHETGPVVAVPVQTTLERIIWVSMASEDYYVRLAGSGRILGTVGRWLNEKWNVTGDRDEVSNHFTRRSYKTRDAAVSALVRYYVSTTGVKI